MANEQEAAAGLYSLLKANAEDGTTPIQVDPSSSITITNPAIAVTMDPTKIDDDGIMTLPSPKFDASQTTPLNTKAAIDEDEEDPNAYDNVHVGLPIPDSSTEGIQKLTEMLLQNRPVVDPLKNQGFGIVTPHPHDILSGRGNGANQHPGNIYFRRLINKYKHHYILTGPSEKKLITKKIVEEVQSRNPPGRFLKQNSDNELYDGLDMDKVLKKTGQALREKAPELKKRAREEFKTKVTTSDESYFQNSRPSNKNGSSGLTPSSSRAKKKGSKGIMKTADYAPYMNMNIFNGNDSHSHSSMSFPMQQGTLDALAYQTIPLASPAGGTCGINGNDSFNMAQLTTATNQVQVPIPLHVPALDPIIIKKTEMLIEKASDPNVTLNQLFEHFLQNPEMASTITHTQTTKYHHNDQASPEPNTAMMLGYNSSSTPMSMSTTIQGRSSIPTTYTHTSTTAPTTIQHHNINLQQSIPNATIFRTPHSHDVLFNEGILVPSHPGSQYFHSKVNTLLPQYKQPLINSKRLEQQIIVSIGSRWPPGRFLSATDPSCTSWQVLSFDQTLHAISTHFQRLTLEATQRIVIPDPRDVLVVRGNSHHQGNLFFRTLIEKHTANVDPKHIIGGVALGPGTLRKKIAGIIVNDIERNGGRFLKFNIHTNFWEQLDHENAILKTLQDMKDFCKKKDSQLKAVKPVGVIVPTLSYIKENVESTIGNDPPGVFYNYYSSTCNGNGSETMAFSANSNDPPGQVPTVIPRVKKGDTSTSTGTGTTKKHGNGVVGSNMMDHIGTGDLPNLQSIEHIEHYPDINAMTAVTVNKKRNMSHELDVTMADTETRHKEKRIRLEP